MRLTITQARGLGIRSLAALGYGPGDAAEIVDHLLDCELRGLEFSGLARILSIAERLGPAGATTAPHRVARESPVSAQLDGADRIGYLVGNAATALAVEKARVSGIGIVGANRTWYTGMLSYYAEQIVSAGMVAVVASNATPWVAPFGGTEPRFGTNPICFGFPSTGTPVVWDIGISEIIHAQAVIADRTGRPLPEGVAYDATGAATTDPVAALGGAFVSWGGHRGSGLGVVVQLLGVLAGSPILPGQLEDFGFLVLAVRPDLFVDPEEFSANVAEYTAVLQATRPVAGGPPVRVPFQRSAALRAERLASGSIELDDVVHAALLGILRDAV